MAPRDLRQRDVRFRDHEGRRAIPQYGVIHEALSPQLGR